MAVDYSLPQWLIPKGFDAQLERMASLQAMEMGAREQQQKREFALRTDQFRLQQQKANLDMAGQVMSNQMMSDEMEDQHAIQSVLPQWQQGNFDVSPEGLKTIKGMAAAERLKTGIMSQNTLGLARIAMDKDATAVIEDDPYNAAMLSQFKPYSPDYAKALRGMVDTMKAKQLKSAVTLRQAPNLVPGSLAQRREQQDADNTGFANFIADGGDPVKGFALFPLANSPLAQSLMRGQDTTEIATDEEGRPKVTITRGGPSKAGKTEPGAAPTVGFATKTQDRLAKYENAVQLMNQLSTGLQAGHVGLAGNVGEYLVDRGLAQVVPGAADQKRIDMRAALTSLREELMRELSSDTQRFSLADREAITEALPERGVFESLPDALGRIERAKSILTDRSRVYAQKLGVLPPPFAMTLSEIAKAFADGEKAIKAGEKPGTASFKAKYLTKEQAVDAVKKFFPDVITQPPQP